MVEYEVAIDARHGFMVLFACEFRLGERIGSTCRARSMAEIQYLKSMGFVAYEMRQIHEEIESFTQMPARLVRLAVKGGWDWMTDDDHAEIDRLIDGMRGEAA